RGAFARLRLEPLVESGAVAHEAGEIRGGPELAHQPRGMPGGAAGEAPLLQQHDVTPTETGEMVGDGGADDAAADDDGARGFDHGQGSEYVLTLVKLFIASSTPSLSPRPRPLIPPTGES